VSVPRELLDAARIDGAGEVKIFFRLAMPLMVPGLMTVLLLGSLAN
jgi:multiple sugar transport system permease protein